MVETSLHTVGVAFLVTDHPGKLFFTPTVRQRKRRVCFRKSTGQTNFNGLNLFAMLRTVVGQGQIDAFLVARPTAFQGYLFFGFAGGPQKPRCAFTNAAHTFATPGTGQTTQRTNIFFTCLAGPTQCTVTLFGTATTMPRTINIGPRYTTWDVARTTRPGIIAGTDPGGFVAQSMAPTDPKSSGRACFEFTTFTKPSFFALARLSLQRTRTVLATFHVAFSFVAHNSGVRF